MRLHELPTRDEQGNVRVVVESPRGSTVKLKYEPRLGVFTISRPLILGMAYPYDWGFIPSTLGPDGDALDAMVLLDAATFPGVVVPCRPIGVVRVEQNKSSGEGRERNDRILFAPTVAPRFEDLTDVAQLPERVRVEIETFFKSVVALADKELDLLGCVGPAEADGLIDEGARRYQRQK